MPMPELRSPNALLQRGLADGAILIALVGWWFTARDLPAFVLPGPFDVAKSIVGFVSNQDMLVHVIISFVRVGLSVLAALVLAVLLAKWAHGSIIGSAIIERRVLLILNSFPSVGWAILAVIWFGVSNSTVIFIQVMIVLPFCLVNAIEGFRQLDTDLDELGRSLSRSVWRRFSKVTLPLIMPFLMAGLRIAYGICWKIALVSELFGASSGLGYLLLQAQSNADGATIFAVCIVIVILFSIVDKLVLAPLSERFSRNRGVAT